MLHLDNENISEIDGIMVDEDGIPYGWEEIRLTGSERNALCDAADAGDIDTADEIVKGAYDRLFGESIN